MKKQNQRRTLTQLSKGSDLQKEIAKDLRFFITTDIMVYGYVTEKTKECFNAQNVEIPFWKAELNIKSTQQN